MGGHVFEGKSSPIDRHNIDYTLKEFFTELVRLFPQKESIFNQSTFIPIGSTGKKSVSGDIDLGIDRKDLINSGFISEWGIDRESFKLTYQLLVKRARTSSLKQLRLKAFLIEISKIINSKSNMIKVDEKKINTGCMFLLFPQFTHYGCIRDCSVQIDIMVGDISWLMFSYYSCEYPKDSTIKGLHRTQLLVALFQVAGLLFSHNHGIKDKVSNKIVANTSQEALDIINARLGIRLTLLSVMEYVGLMEYLKSSLSQKLFDDLLNIYLKILDSTRCGIPSNILLEWNNRKEVLGLSGKFKPVE